MPYYKYWSAAMSLLLFAGCSTPATAQGDPAIADAVSEQQATPVSDAVAQLSSWVIASHDNGDLPFLIIDKTAARVFAFDRVGVLTGEGPILVGSSPGDVAPEGIGNRPISSIKKGERITPAGRFAARIGRALGAYSQVLWIDYPSSLAMHPVVTSNPREQRVRRLRSPEADDNRITYGCVNVSASFYKNVVVPLFTPANGIVYIVPETKSLEDVFPAYQAVAAAPVPAQSSAQ